MPIARRIVGPQERYERTGAQSLRDIRPFTVRLAAGLRGPASGLVLAVAAIGTFVEPAVVDLTVPLSVLYALWVLTRRPRLPMRLPRTAGCPDPSDPAPGSRKPKPANGTWFLGWSVAGHELWATAEDARQHIAIPGTTGAGKTTAILSLLANALAQGSGFVLVDGKADRDLFGKVLALARRFGRDDDVRVLNFMVASGLKDSHTFNAFAAGNADAIRELLASQLGEQQQNDPNGVFRERAVALIGTIAPVLVWLRDHKGVALNIDVIRFSIELRWIWKLAMEKIVLLRDPATGAINELDVGAEIPEDITWPLKSYLGELPGYDPSVPLDKQKGDEPSKQHGYAQFYFTATFTQLAVSLGHIFRVENGDIDMRDIVLNRRILVVNLPALENSDATLAALGKLVVASLRGMMAQLLGASLEGDYTEADKPGMGPSPFPVVLDELAYYATSGLDRMLAMGRGLNIAFILGFQEVSGIWARLGEKTASLLGNANLTIAMRQQDAGRTREWIEKTAGQTYITQATAYHGAADGAYREARHAEVRPVSRIDWNDLTNLIEGEAIVLFGGRRIYARIFHAKIDDRGPKRLGRTVMLRRPDPDEVRRRSQRIGEIAAVIASGRLGRGPREEASPGLEALLRGFAHAAARDTDPAGCARCALAAIAELPDRSPSERPPATPPEPPVTSLSSMLAAASRESVMGAEIRGERKEPVDLLLARDIAAIEAAAGATPAAARRAALAMLAERETALRELPVVDPPEMPGTEFQARLGAAMSQLEMLERGRSFENVKDGVGAIVRALAVAGLVVAAALAAHAAHATARPLELLSPASAAMGPTGPHAHPMIPAPLPADAPQALLAASRAVRAGRTADAEALLERAETQLLNTAAASAAPLPASAAVIEDIAAARRAVAEGDREEAVRAIDSATAASAEGQGRRSPPAVAPAPQPAAAPRPPVGPLYTYVLFPGHWRLAGAGYVWVPPDMRLRPVVHWHFVPGTFVWRDGTWVWAPPHYQ